MRVPSLAVVLIIYPAFFVVSLRLFLSGHHVAAYLVLFAVFVLLVGYIARRQGGILP